MEIIKMYGFVLFLVRSWRLNMIGDGVVFYFINEYIVIILWGLFLVIRVS